MFRQLPIYLMNVPGTTPPTPALVPPSTLFNKHPLDIVAYMENYWNKRKPQPPLPRLRLRRCL